MSFSQLDPTNTLSSRLQLDNLLAPSSDQDDGKDVIAGLSSNPKTLPPRYFYDSHGSQLFEQICTLPEYYPTRTEASILEKYSGAIAKLTGACEIIELGSGSSTKTRLLLDAYQKLNYPLLYLPIDVSGSILQSSAYELLADYPSLQVHGLIATYQLAFQQLPPLQLPRRMMIFLGSTIGNLDPMQCDRFLTNVSSALEAGDFFLLGIDLQKSPEVLEAAYNDSQGVTAAFNLNMLQHLNQRFDGNFDLNLFEHRAFYHQELAQIEMHLVAKKFHHVELEKLDLKVDFDAGESIRTEISRKFNLQQMQDYLGEHQLQPVQAWTDERDWFGLVLTQKVI